MHNHSTSNEGGFQDVPWEFDPPAKQREVSREEHVASMLSSVENMLAQAGEELYREFAGGISEKEAADSLGVSEQFLGVLRNFGVRRIANDIFHAIECRRIEIREHESNIAALRQELELVESGDEGAILSLIGKDIR